MSYESIFKPISDELLDCYRFTDWAKGGKDIYVTGEPSIPYKKANWASMIKIEDIASQAGFELLLRVTNNADSLPSRREIKFLQTTEWVFGLKDFDMTIILEYRETIDDLNKFNDIYRKSVCTIYTNNRSEPNYEIPNYDCSKYDNHYVVRYTGYSFDELDYTCQAFPLEFWQFWASKTKKIKDNSFCVGHCIGYWLCDGSPSAVQLPFELLGRVQLINLILKSNIAKYYDIVTLYHRNNHRNFLTSPENEGLFPT